MAAKGTDQDKQEIEIHLAPCGSYFVWNSEMAIALQRQYRIYGRYIGTLPRSHHQNSCLGLPLFLSLEEVEVARKQPMVRVLRNTSVADKPSNEDAFKVYESQMEQHYKEMTSIHVEKKRLEMVRHYHTICKGLEKRRERLMKRKAAGEEVSEEDLAKCDPQGPFTVEDVAVDVPPPEKVLRHLPHATPKTWVKEGEIVEDEKAEEAEDLTEEQKAMRHLRCRVFEDLWSKGHHVTVSAAKMGGDFLIYPGDPLRYHASHIVVLSSLSKVHSLLDTASLLRLSSSVKKIILMASLDEENDDVIYTTLAWSGVG